MTSQHDDAELLRPIDVAGSLKAAEEQTLSFEAKWAALELEADRIAAEPWPAMKAVAAIAAAASDLEIYRLSQRQFEQLLEAAHRRRRPMAAPIPAGGTFVVHPTAWAVDGLLRHSLNLLVGSGGAGKSRMAASLMAAWLRGDATWLGRTLYGPPVEQRHALIIGTDQPRSDWRQTLEPFGLCSTAADGRTQLHPRVDLHPLETGTLLDADGLALIRRWADAHPGGMVLADSLATLLPPGTDEDKAAAARPVHDLQEALGSCWGLLCQHARKAAGRDGNLGVGAGRGSGAIDAAVSRVVGLGLIHRMEGGTPVPQESDPRRELLSTKRGGPPVHLIVDCRTWEVVGDAQELKRQERQGRIRQNLTEDQANHLAVLEERPGQWLTVRDVVEALDKEWTGARGAAAAHTRRVLRRLAELGLANPASGGTEASYQASHADEINTTRSPSSPPATPGISPVHPNVHPCSPPFTPCGDSDLKDSAPPGPPSGQGEHGEQGGEQGGEHLKPQSQQGVNGVNTPPSTGPDLSGCSPPAAPDPFPPGMAVELRQPDGSWRNGYRIAGPPDPQGLIPLSLAGQTRIHQWVRKRNLRPCSAA